MTGISIDLVSDPYDWGLAQCRRCRRHCLGVRGDDGAELLLDPGATACARLQRAYPGLLLRFNAAPWDWPTVHECWTAAPAAEAPR